MSSAPRPPARERAVLVGLSLPEVSRSTVEDHLDELAKLVESAGGEVVGRLLQDRKAPDSATYIGKGKAEEVGELVKKERADLIIIDDEISAAQARNIEKMAGVRVIDRSALILDIFAKRARSRESRTQVELAQLSYLLPRLTRAWTHLERQAGGIGGRGVGETQLELDRRIVRTRIARLKEELEKIEKNRETQRRGRGGTYTVSLVGYTNAGKSTLFNQLTEGSVAAVDKLFATLDAKATRSTHPLPRETVFIDTVGFIRKLPHHLVASFRSTMEEAVASDLVLHVINASHPQVEEQRTVGREVLADLGIEPGRWIDVYNKMDQLSGENPVQTDNEERVEVSALTGEGLDQLLERIRQRELREGEVVQLEIPVEESRAIALLHELAKIQSSEVEGEAMKYVAWVPNEHLHNFEPFRTSNDSASASLAS